MKKLLLLITLFTFGCTAGAQAGMKYRFMHESGPFSPLSNYQTSSEITHALTDDSAAPLTVRLPFLFSIGGADFDEVNINPNGYFWFGDEPLHTMPAYWPLTRGGRPRVLGLVSALGVDLIPRQGTELKSAVVGTAPFRTFIAQWLGAARRGDNGLAVPGDSLNFQIRLYETSGRIEVSYGVMNINPNVQSDGEVGIRALLSNDLNVRTGSWQATSTGSFASSRISINILNRPAMGQLLVWEPDPSATAVEAVPTEDGLSLYPVPAADHLFVRDPEGRFSRGAYALYSATGALVHSGWLSGDNSISTSALPGGTYLLWLSRDGRRECLSFVKANR